MKYVGLDFGTANTSAAKVYEGKTEVITFEDGSGSMPSAAFFDFDENSFHIGQAAFDRYYFGDNGRFLRSFKSALGTSTIDHEIRIKQDLFTIKDITQQYIAKVLNRVETNIGDKLDSLVVGRPVQFVDDDPVADKNAQDQLNDVVAGLGVQHIEFQLEPIAAALNYGVTVNGEETVLVIDIGAGTSDFSVVKFNGAGDIHTLDSKVISNCGVHIGGNDFDKVVTLNRVMPHLGYQCRFKHRPDLETPKSYFLHASSWHQIDFLYDRKVINALREISPQMQDPSTIDRFIDVILKRKVHLILAEIENVKKQFSNKDEVLINLPFIDSGLNLELNNHDFDLLINPMSEKIINTANQAITDAGLTKADINTVYITGGSMGLRHLFNMVVNEFSCSNVIEGDKSTAVARGLALDASQKFS